MFKLRFSAVTKKTTVSDFKECHQGICERPVGPGIPEGGIFGLTLRCWIVGFYLDEICCAVLLNADANCSLQ